MDVPLQDELLLLAYEPQTGRPRAGSTELDCGLAGAALVELTLAGRIELRDGKVNVLDRAPVGDREIDALLVRILGEARNRKPDWWVGKLRHGLRSRQLAQGIDRGLLRMQRQPVLRLFSVRRYFPLDARIAAAAHVRLEWALVHQGDPDPRTAALAALLDATGLARRLFPDVGRKQLKTRMSEISGGQWQGAAVRKAIRAIQSSD